MIRDAGLKTHGYRLLNQLLLKKSIKEEIKAELKYIE